MNLEGCSPIEKYCLTVLYERVGDDVRKGIERICEYAKPADWTLRMKVEIYQRMIAAANLRGEGMTEDQAERAAIMEFDGGLGRWAAEDYAMKGN